jgi:hypothetical protein
MRGTQSSTARGDAPPHHLAATRRGARPVALSGRETCQFESTSAGRAPLRVAANLGGWTALGRRRGPNGDSLLDFPGRGKR